MVNNNEKMQLPGCEYDNHGNNLTWINQNIITGKEFAEKNCPFKALMKDLNQKLESGELTIDECNMVYNADEHSTIKITAYDTRVEFVLCMAKNENRSSYSYPLGYDYEPYKYEAILKKCYWKLKKDLDGNCVF